MLELSVLLLPALDEAEDAMLDDAREVSPYSESFMVSSQSIPCFQSLVKNRVLR